MRQDNGKLPLVRPTYQVRRSISQVQPVPLGWPHGATRPIDQSGSSICRDVQSSEWDFPEKSGRFPKKRLGESAHPIGAFISRRVIARQLRRLVIRRVGVIGDVIIAYGREKSHGWSRSRGTHSDPALIYDWLISGTIDFPESFSRYRCRRLWSGAVHWNSRSSRS